MAKRLTLFILVGMVLGIITGAALRLHPQTPNTAHAWVSVADPAAAVALLAAMQDRVGSAIQAFELVSASQFELVVRHVERIRIPCLPVSWRIAAGSRLRLSIAGADADHCGQVPHGRPPLLTLDLARCTVDLPVAEG